MEARDIYRSESERKAEAIVKEIGRNRCLTLHVEQDEEGGARVVWQVPPGVQLGSPCPLAVADEDEGKGEPSTLECIAELIGAKSLADVPSQVERLVEERMRLEAELEELRSTLRKALG